jgi:transcriptional regulator with XRE-family HTH domain
MNTLEDRLIEERKRFGLSQAAFGEAGGVQKRAQINYEKGERHPDAAYLERLAAIGVDVLYVLTGRRAPAGNGYAAAEPGPVGDLSLPELGLIKGFRGLDAKGRRAVLAMIEALAKPAPSQVFNGPVENLAGRDVKHIATGDVEQGNGGRIG